MIYVEKKTKMKSDCNAIVGDEYRETKINIQCKLSQIIRENEYSIIRLFFT